MGQARGKLLKLDMRQGFDAASSNASMLRGWRMAGHACDRRCMVLQPDWPGGLL